MNDLLNQLQNLWNTVFDWLDSFGRDHWGFILAVVFLLYIGDRLIIGVRREIMWSRRRVNMWRARRMANHFPGRRPLLNRITGSRRFEGLGLQFGGTPFQGNTRSAAAQHDDSLLSFGRNDLGKSDSLLRTIPPEANTLTSSGRIDMRSRSSKPHHFI